MLAEMRIMDKNEIINSQKLKEETEKEFGTKIIESNSGSTRYSSRDKSYSNRMGDRSSDQKVKIIIYYDINIP